ncbi:MAG TPA: TonB-dependent receptor [Chitinophagaceae bacterium]
MRKMIALIVCVLVAAGQLLAQSRTINGKVTQDNDRPLAGASVIVKGTNIGTTTKDDGTYSLTLPANAKILIVSSINMEQQEIPIGGKSVINVTLKPGDKDLQEVVVVGYGTKSTRENTGSISKIGGAKMAAEPVASFDQALGGKTAGVQVTLGSGVLADRTAIRIRGINSISSSSQPLVVVDGIPQNNVTNLNGFNGGNGTRFDPLALINPNDIESIEVLKDAGASVIYGSRASNGVLLVTTKKGKKGSMKVNYDSKVGWSTASKLPPLLNGDDFTTITNEKGSNRFGTGTPYASMAQNSDINGDGKPDRTNWNDIVYRKAMTYDNSISFSGGSDKMQAYGSARYLKEEGITIGNKLTSGQIRLNLDFTPKTWFKAGVQTSYTKTLNNGVLTDAYIAGTTISGWQAEPNVSPYNPAGAYGYNLTANGLLGNGNNVTTIGGVNYLPSASYYLNILPQIKLQRNDNTAEDLRANIYGELQPIKGLKLTSKFGIQYLNNFEDQYSSPLVNGLGSSYGGLVQDQSQQYNLWTWQNYVNFDKTIGGVHKIGFVAGTEYQKNTYFSLYTGANNFTDPFFVNVINGAYTNTIPGSSTLLDNTGGNLNASGIISYFGRLNYSYAGKYFIEGSLRRDGYSGFGSNYQFGNFPSISLGWEVTKENFMSHIAWLDYLKIRGSYGQVGNSNGVGPYSALTLFSGAAYTSLNGLGITQAGNSSLRWETAKKTDVGFEANVLKNKIGIVVDYFDNNIDGLILAAPTLYTVGIPGSSITSNIGGMYNKGFEVTINSTPVTMKNFSWNTSFNFTRIWNKVTGLVPSNGNADINPSGIAAASLGKRLGVFYMPKWAGVDPQTGNPEWYAANGTIKRYNFGATGANIWTDDKGIPTAALGAGDYVYQSKSGLPTYYGNWDNTFSYKSFELSFSFSYQGGNLIYNSSTAGMMTNAFSNNFSLILQRWQKPGDITNVPKLWLADNTANQASTRWLENGDFIRMRSITAAYNFKKSLLDKIGFDNARFFVQVFNPFVITKYSGLDPDVSTSGTVQANGNISVGIDARATPQPRVVTLGLNLSF